VSSEGIALVTRAALVLFLISAAALFRYLIGPGKPRGLIMGLATLGGMAAGVAAAALISPRLGTDISALSACAGMVLGWCVAWMVVRETPREAR
jgi:hypothetical protein